MKYLEDVTCIMSVYHNDQVEWVREAIDSILYANRAPGEFLIYCDGPVSEELYSTLDKYVYEFSGRVKIYKGKENRGRAYSRQYLVDHVDSAYIMIMDADDISLPDRLEKQYDFALLHPSVDVIGGWISEFGLGGKERIREVPLNEESIRKRGKYLQPFNHVTLLVKKKAIQKVGGYQDAGDCEDYFLIARWLVSEVEMRNISDVVVRVRVSSALLDRRRGWKHFYDEFMIAKYLKLSGYIGWYEFTFVSFVKLLARALPSVLLGLIYRGLRRSV